MNLRKLLSTTLCLCIFLSSVQQALAAENTLSLKEAILLALRYNPNVRNAQLQRIVDKFNLRLQQNAFEVQYALTGNVTYNRSRIAGDTASSTSSSISPQANLLTPIGTQVTATWNDNRQAGNYQPNATLSVNQPLLSGFGSEITQAALHNQEDQEVINKLLLKNQIITTVTNVATAYRSLVMANNNLLTAKLSLSSLQDTEKENQALIAAGRKAPTDIVQAQAQLANQQLNIQQAENTVEQAKLTLLNFLGIEPSREIQVVNTIEIPALPKLDKDASIQLALKNDISYQSALSSLKILHRNLLVAKDQARWQLNLNATTTLGNSTTVAGNTGVSSIGDNYNQTVGLKLNIPISNLPQKAAIARAKIALEQQQIQTESLKTQISNHILTALFNVQSSYASVQQGEKATHLVEQSLSIAKAKLRYGRVSTFEVVNLERDYSSSLIANTANKIAYLNALTNLQQALGTTLSEWDIEIKD